MIEINLLPGTGKKKASRGGGGGGPKLDLGATFAGLSSSVKDKFLAAAIVAVALAVGGIGTLYTFQEHRAD